MAPRPRNQQAQSRSRSVSSTSSGLPKSWPPNVTYLIAPVYSKFVGRQAQEKLHTPPPGTVSETIRPPRSGPAPTVRITLITNSEHPANGQYGLFATQNIPPNTFILLYLGFVHGNEDADPQSDYDLSIDREFGMGIDATKMGNEARFINDYRGVGPAGPNAEFREVLVDTGRGKIEKRMAVYVLSAGKSGKRAKGIGKGEEILVSYGKGFWNERRKCAVDEEKPNCDVGEQSLS